MNRSTLRAGFTLIELLIVVAIIAILAAIAVPNFLEAQTRAKVSRVKADLRSLVTALEAYQVDWNSYTWCNTGSDSPEENGRWGGLGQLTTPVAYITTIPRDPFGMSRYSPAAGDRHWAVYEIGSGVGGLGGTGRPWVGEAGTGLPSNVFEVESDGPDHFDDTIGTPFRTGAFPWPDVASNAASVPGVLALCYDPTNGTVSTGEIYKVGGNKPSGIVLDVFWANASR